MRGCLSGGRAAGGSGVWVLGFWQLCGRRRGGRFWESTFDDLRVCKGVGMGDDLVSFPKQSSPIVSAMRCRVSFSSTRAGAFTLLELLAAVAIIGALAAILLPSLSAVRGRRIVGGVCRISAASRWRSNRTRRTMMGTCPRRGMRIPARRRAIRICRVDVADGAGAEHDGGAAG